MFKGQSVKILIIGPVQSGKSSIANFLADREDVLSESYRPTAAVRIVEFEKEAPKNPKRPGQEKVLVELWDVSGDSKYDNCWSAMQKGAQGVIVVYNAENPKHEQELEGWVNQFPKKIGMPSSLCVGFAHHLTGRAIKGQAKLRNSLFCTQNKAKGISNLQVHDTSIEEGAQRIVPAFDKFFTSVMMHIYEKQEKEENTFMD